VKWGAPISNGGPGTIGPPAGDDHEAKCCVVERKAEWKGRSEMRVRKVAEEHIVVCERQSEMLTGERAWMRRNVAGEKMRNDVWMHGGAGRGP